MQVKKESKKYNVMIINCIDMNDDDKEKLASFLYPILEEAGDDLATFNLDDDDHITLYRNGDYLEPDGEETKEGRF